MTVFFQFAPPAADASPGVYSDALVNFVFATNVASQDTSGNAAESASTQVVWESLRPTPIRESVVLVAVSGQPDLSAFRRSPLGYPLIAADTAAGHPSLPDDADVLGYVDATLTPGARGVDAGLVVGVDYLPETPGGVVAEPELEAWRELLVGVAGLVRATGRSLLRVWRGVPLPGQDAADDFAWELLDHGYYLGVTESCGVLPTHPAGPEPALPPGYDYVVCDNHQYADEQVAPLLQLYAVADMDMPIGELTRDTVPWTREWLQHQLTTGEQSLSVVLTHSGTVVGLSEVRRVMGSGYAEQQITVIARPHRGMGLALGLKSRLLAAVREQWPEVQSIYTTIAADNEPMLQTNYSLGFQEISHTQCFEKVF